VEAANQKEFLKTIYKAEQMKKTTKAMTKQKTNFDEASQGMDVNVSWYNPLIQLLTDKIFMAIFWVYPENAFSLTKDEQ
jgi:phage I-like protein